MANTDNAELLARIDAIVETLEGIEAGLAMLCEQKIDEQDARQLAEERLARLHARASAWPWSPATSTQGFLAARWLRRDGNSYGGAALRGVQGPNSPIRGGDDNQAKVSVPSGAPRV